MTEREILSPRESRSGEDLGAHFGAGAADAPSPGCLPVSFTVTFTARDGLSSLSTRGLRVLCAPGMSVTGSRSLSPPWD